MNSQTNHRCGRHQIGCSTTWNFFLAANWDIVWRGISNSSDASWGATPTTIKPHPYLRHVGISLSPLVSASHSVDFNSRRRQSFQSEWQCIRSFGNYVRVSSYLWMWRAPHSWLRGCKPLFPNSTYLSFLLTKGYLSIRDFLFNRWSRTTGSLILEFRDM